VLGWGAGRRASNKKKVDRETGKLRRSSSSSSGLPIPGASVNAVGLPWFRSKARALQGAVGTQELFEEICGLPRGGEASANATPLFSNIAVLPLRGDLPDCYEFPSSGALAAPARLGPKGMGKGRVIEGIKDWGGVAGGAAMSPTEISMDAVGGRAAGRKIPFLRY